jgi:hypothetical protein
MNKLKRLEEEIQILKEDKQVNQENITFKIKLKDKNLYNFVKELNNKISNIY